MEQDSVLRRQARAEAAVRIAAEVAILRAAGVRDPYQLPCDQADEILERYQKTGLRGLRRHRRVVHRAHHKPGNRVWGYLLPPE